jgi:hypothetical protein
MNKKQLEILENNFKIYKDNNIWDLERWTDGGVDMFINIDTTKNIIEEFEFYLDNFDIDEEIDLYRQDKSYKEVFTIRQSVEDFEGWVEFIKEILQDLYEAKDENN